MKFDPKNMSLTNVAAIPAQRSARCLRWNPIQENLLAIGLFDGRIIIYDVEKNKKIQVHQGTEEKILCIEWHPQLVHMLAAGSFDNIIQILDNNDSEKKKLKFHTDCVRSLVWSSEIPWMLTSGADDSKQVVWDIRNNQCI